MTNYPDGAKGEINPNYTPPASIKDIHIKQIFDVSLMPDGTWDIGFTVGRVDWPKKHEVENK